MPTAPSCIQNCPLSCLVTPKTFVNVMELQLTKQLVSSKLKQSEYRLVQPRGTWTNWRWGVFKHCSNIPHSVLWNKMIPKNFCQIRPLFSQHFCGDEKKNSICGRILTGQTLYEYLVRNRVRRKRKGCAEAFPRQWNILGFFSTRLKTFLKLCQRLSLHILWWLFFVLIFAPDGGYCLFISWQHLLDLTPINKW